MKMLKFSFESKSKDHIGKRKGKCLYIYIYMECTDEPLSRAKHMST